MKSILILHTRTGNCHQHGILTAYPFFQSTCFKQSECCNIKVIQVGGQVHVCNLFIKKVYISTIYLYYTEFRGRHQIIDKIENY